MALSGDDRARLIRSGKLAHSALAATHAGSRRPLRPGGEAAPVANVSERAAHAAPWPVNPCSGGAADGAPFDMARTHREGHLPSFMERSVR